MISDVIAPTVASGYRPRLIKPLGLALGVPKIKPKNKMSILLPVYALAELVLRDTLLHLFYGGVT